MGFRARPFLPSVELLYRILFTLELPIGLTATWKDGHHGFRFSLSNFLHPFLSQVSNLHHYLKAFSTPSSSFPLYLLQALPPNELLALLISCQHLLLRPPEWTQEWSEKAGSKIRFGICITHYLACSKNLSCVRMWDLGQNGDPIAKTFTDGEVGQCSYGAVIQAY